MGKIELHNEVGRNGDWDPKIATKSCLDESPRQGLVAAMGNDGLH